MRPGREIDTRIAEEILGHRVKVKKKELWEEAPLGERPLRNYSRDIGHAWEVIEKMGVTLIPVEGKSWFAFVGPRDRWTGPADFIECLQAGNFADAGAAVGENPALIVCIAALKALESRAKISEQSSAQPPEPHTHH